MKIVVKKFRRVSVSLICSVCMACGIGFSALAADGRMLYVSASAGSDGNDGLTWSTAKKSIQSAIDASQAGDRITVTNGVYGAIDVGLKEVSIVSVDGPEQTVIDARSESRCVTFDLNNTNAVMTGFTLCNGRAETGGGVSGGKLDRCIIRNNVAYKTSVQEGYHLVWRGGLGGGAYKSTLSNCLVADNASEGYGGGLAFPKATYCTIVKNHAVYDTAAAHDGWVVMSIVRGNVVEGKYEDGYYYGTEYGALIMYSCLGQNPGDDSYRGEYECIYVDPRFVSFDYGNYRLRSGSPCIDAAYELAEKDAGMLDLSGQPRQNGDAVDMGAYEGAVIGSVVAFDPGEHGAVGTNAPQVQVIASGGAATDPGAAGNIGYRFTGWSATFDNIVGDLCVTARYESAFSLDVTNAQEAVSYVGHLAAGDATGLIWVGDTTAYRVTRESPTYCDPTERAVTRQVISFNSDGWMARDLLFDFPFYGKKYRRVCFTKYGSLMPGEFEIYSANEVENYLYPDSGDFPSVGRPLIGSYWDSFTVGEVICQSSATEWTMTWIGTKYEMPIRFSVTLYPNGAIRMSFGSGNEGCCPLVGLTKGDGTDYTIFDNRTGASYDHVDDIVYYPNGGLPEGISLALDGTLSGVCNQAGEYDFTVVARDAQGACGAYTPHLSVETNANLRPVLVEASPVREAAAGIGVANMFHAVATDPEGETITYAWSVNGVMTDCSGTDFGYVPAAADIGTNVVVCYASDGVWHIPVKTWMVHARYQYLVDGTNGNDANDGKTWATAKKTIQAAIDLTPEDGAVVVADGVYSPISSGGKRIVIESVNGALSTIIDGGGTARCASLNTAYNLSSTTLQGFTLRNGYAENGGGAYSGMLKNCILTGNVATFGGGGAADCTLMENCLVYGNRSKGYWGAVRDGYVVLRNCTICDNVTEGASGGVSFDVAYNSIIWNNPDGPGATVRSNEVHDCCTDMAVENSSTGVMRSDPQFIAPGLGDYRLRSGSPCIDAGADGVTASDLDVLGGARVMGARIDLGACEQDGSTALTVLYDAGEHGRITDGQALWFLSPGESATAPSVVTDFGWIFGGWPVTAENVTSNMTIVAPYSSAGAISPGVATEKVSYAAQLTLSGATEPVFWTLETDRYSLSSTANTYSEEDGVALGLTGDDDATEYTLPFTFSFYGKTYSTVYPNKNGCLYFDGRYTYYSYSEQRMKEHPMIAALFRDVRSGGDVYATEDPDGNWVKFRWGQSSYHFSATLYKSGKIVLSYGSCAYSGAVGISAGDSSRLLMAGTSLVCSDGVDYVFMPAGCPEWMSIQSDGTVTGNPEIAGEYSFDVYAEDAEGRTAKVPVTVTVAENPNKRPVVEDFSPADATNRVYLGQVLDFSVSATDPNGDALTCVWTWDGTAIDGATALDYQFVATSATHGRHTLGCSVTDGLWKIPVAEWQLEVIGLFHVSPEGDDAADGLGWETARCTIQSAIDLAIDGDVILVTNGVYAPITVMGNPLIEIRSVEGASATIIDGGNTNRCAKLGNDSSQTNVALVGFTLRNGFNDVYGESGGGVCAGTTKGCILEDCQSRYGGGASQGILCNCVIRRCHTTNRGGGAYYSKLYNCTVVDDSAPSDGAGVYGCQCYNSIVWGNVLSNWKVLDMKSNDSSYYNCWRDGDPGMVSLDGGDARLRADSPCLNAGNNVYVRSETDIAGNVRIQGGTVDIGAYEGGCEGVRVTAEIVGTGMASPTSAFVQPGASATFAAQVTDRPFLGFSLDGENIVETGETFTLEDIQADGKVYLHFAQIHVDGENGDDSRDGLSEAMAVRTIQKGIDLALVGETVFVAPGVYAPISSGGKGIVIKGVGGPAVCIIDAGGNGRCATLGDEYGRYTVLEGFTLRNGNSNSYAGGGAYGGILRNCWLIGNRTTSRGGGGAYYSELESCRLEGNTASDGGGGAYNGVLKNCQIVGNTAKNCGAAYNSKLYHCTVVGNVTTNADLKYCSAISYADSFYSCQAYDCIVWGNVSANGEIANCEGIRSEYANNCFAQLRGAVASSNTIRQEDPLLAVNDAGYYVPTVGSSCLDAGTPSYVQTETDIAGRPRVQGARVDVGAWEGVAKGCVVRTVLVGVGDLSESRVTAAGSVVTVSAAARDIRHPFVGFQLDGVPVAEGVREADGVYSLDVVAEAPLVTVTATFGTFPIHVRAEGDDEADGMSAATALATIQKAVSLAQPGDEIIVGPGVYAPFGTGGRSLSIRSESGADDTIVEGVFNAYDDRAADLGGTTDTLLTGFTIRGASDGVYGGTVVRCRITDCISGAQNSVLRNCLVDRNLRKDQNGNASYGVLSSRLYNCTVIGNSKGTYESYHYNSIVCRNGTSASTNLDSSKALNSSYASYSSDPGFVSVVNGDYRLRAGSAAIDAGNDAYVMDEVDYAGRVRVQGECVDRGALEGAVEGFVVETAFVGKGSASPVTPIVAAGGSVTIAPVVQGRAFLGFSLNGVDIVSTDASYVVSNVQADQTLYLHFSQDVYVDAARTDGPHDGMSWESARQSLQEAVDDAQDGDTIHVATGCYGPISTANKRISIIGEDGFENCIIDCGYAGRCATLGLENRSDATNTVLRFFTLRNGYDSSRDGGGALGGTLIQCVLTGNSADYGGGACYSALHDCLIVGNTAASGGGTYSCRLYNCTVVKNTATGTYGGGGIHNGYLYNSIVWGNKNLSNRTEYDNRDNGALYYCCCEGLTSLSGGNIADDPLFVNPDGGDWRLSPGSPCLNAGRLDFVAIDVDLAGDPRVTGSAVNMGAYQRTGGGAFVAAEVTGGTGLYIPDTWFESFPRFVELYGDDFDAAAVKPTGKTTADRSPMYVWQDYVVGTDPTDTNSVFQAQIEMVDGVLFVSWTPYLNSNGTERIYRILGKSDLADGDESWRAVSEEHRFFKVSVTMPQASERSDEPGLIEADKGLLCRLTFDDAGNDGLNVLKSEGGADAIVRTTQANAVVGLGAVEIVTDSSVLAGLEAGDGAVFIPQNTHLALPIPEALLDRQGHPYTLKMKVRFPGFGPWFTLLNLPASNDSDALIYLSNSANPVINMKLMSKGSAVGGQGGFTANQWETVVIQFDETNTKAFLNGVQIFSYDCNLASSFADCYDAGGYFVISGDDNGDDGSMYWADFKVYDGIVDP